MPIAMSSQNDLDNTLIVEAAAGTGKTTELVNRIVRVIETGRAEVDEIVSVTFTEKAAGELKLRLREELEGSRTKAAAESTERERLDNALRRLEEAQISTIHGFCADLLRERPVEARVDPLFAVLTEAQARRLYDAAFHSWFQEQLSNPSEGVQRSLRRPSFAGFGVSDNEDGPVERLQNAGWELIQWRDFEGDWQRPPFDRQSRIDALVQRLHEFADLSASPAYQYDSFCLDTRAARQLSDDIVRTEKVAARDYSRLEGMLIDLGRNRQFRQARKGSGKFYRPNVPREDVTRARDELQAELTRFETDANADLAVLLREELRPSAEKYEEAKAAAGALDFLDLLLKARNLVRDDEDVRRSFQQRFKRLFVDEFQDTDPLQAEILLLLAADDPRETDWRQGPTRSRQALHRRRPEAVHLPVQARGRRNLSQRLRDAARGGSEARHAAHQLPGQAEHPAHDQRVVRARHDWVMSTPARRTTFRSSRSGPIQRSSHRWSCFPCRSRMASSGLPIRRSRNLFPTPWARSWIG